MNNILLKCNCCQKEFEKYKPEYEHLIKNGRTNFYCSLSCGSKIQMQMMFGKRKEKYDLNPKKCLACNKNLTYEQRNCIYCGRSCRSKHFHVRGICNNLKHGRFVVKPCKICGKSTKGIYCSKICKLENDKLVRIEKLKSGNYSSIPASGRYTLRRALIDIRGNKCENCKLDIWVGVKMPLTVHHIDGDAGNNKLENLNLLCWNCHAITDNYGRKNKNGTRKYRYAKKSS